MRRALSDGGGPAASSVADTIRRMIATCRLANGTSGRCVKLVKDYACIEQRTNAPTQFSAVVTCAKDTESVVRRYTQVCRQATTRRLRMTLR